MRNVFYHRENTGSQICWAWLHKVHSVLGGPLFQGKVSNVIVIFPLGFVVLMWVSINSLRSHLFCNVLGSYSGICWIIRSFGHLAIFLFPNSSLFQDCPIPSIPFPPYSTWERFWFYFTTGCLLQLITCIETEAEYWKVGVQLALGVETTQCAAVPDF